MDRNLDESLRPLLDWLARHINAHRFFWLVALASFLVAWNRGLDLLYGLLALVLAVVAVSWLLPWLAIRGVSVERQQQGPAQAGDALSLRYRVRTPRPCHHLIIREALPCAVVEPARDHGLPSVKDETIFTVAQPCDRRGVFTLDTVTLGSGWPFGFVELFREQPAPPCSVVVMPRTFPIASLPALRTDIPAIDGYNQTARPDINNNFAGVREYRFGDSLKHIHWSASARHQTLIVREYESHDRPHLLVVIEARPETDVGEAPWSSFEYAIMVAASLIEYAVDKQLGLHLLVDGTTPLELTVPSGARSAQAYLEQLAWVRPDGERACAELIDAALERFGDMNALITIRNESEAGPLPRLDTGHLDILLQDESFLYPLRQYRDGWETGTPDRATLRVHRNSNLEALFSA